VDLERAIERDYIQLRRRLTVAGVVAVLALPLVLTVTGQISTFSAAVNALVLGLAAISLVVLVGYVGQISLAQFAFMGIGAVVVARVAPYVGFWAALPIGGLAAIPVGLAAAIPALRLRGSYLAIATLGLSQVVLAAILLNQTVVPGYYISIEQPSLFGHVFSSSFSSRTTLYFVDLVAVAAAALFTLALRHRKTGLAFTAVRDSELAAASVGISVVRYKLIAFALSAFYAGIAGGLYLALSPNVDPHYFDALTGSIPLLVILVIGGVTSIGGALLASFFFAIVPTLLPRVVNSGLNHFGLGNYMNYDLILALFGILLLRGLITTPTGLVGELDRRLRIFTRHRQEKAMVAVEAGKAAAG
jgi:branched-chain amino acid transport system permease protein